MKQLLIVILATVAFMQISHWGRSAKAETTSDQKSTKGGSVLEEIGTIAIARVHVDGFDQLPLKQKLLAYHLYKAAIVGDRILYDQNHRHGLEIKTILEQIVTHTKGINKTLEPQLLEYTKLFWIHHGNRDHNTSLKFVPAFSFDEFVRAATAAMKNGANFGTKSEGELRDRLKRLEGTIFDPNFEPMLTSKSPKPGEDIITASSNNLYEGVTLKDLEQFTEKYPLNSKVAKRGGKLVELVYRAGRAGVPPGLYAKELGRVIEHLRQALEYAEPRQQETLKHLIKFFETGEEEEFRKYNITWVKDNPTIDTINGFIEAYKDARAAKGAYEAAVYFIDQKTTKMMRDLAANAQYFEQKMPWRDEFKKKKVSPPVANTVTVLIETGDSGPVSPVGINLPNEQAIRQQYGSKNIMLINVNQTAEGINAARSADVFSFSPEEKELANRYGNMASITHVGLHEVVGHGSGKVSEKLKEDPRVYLKEYYSTMEEARADLVGLWHLFDPKLVELGILPDEKAAQAGYQRYVRRALSQLNMVPKGDKLEEDHMKGRQMIVNYLKDVAKAVEVKYKNNDVYLVITDFKKMRDGVGELLSELMRIKAEGDYAAMKKLIETYGTDINAQWRDNVVVRSKKAKIPSLVAYVYPKLEAVRDTTGKISDVKLSYYKGLMDEQLDFLKEQ